MHADFDDVYVKFIRAQSEQTRRHLLNLPYPAEMAQRFEAMAQASFQAQAEIEAADTLPFEAYRQQYVSPQRMAVP